MRVKIHKPKGYLSQMNKERIVFLLCLANFGGAIKTRISDERMWKHFRKGHFTFSRYDFFHVFFLDEVSWSVIFDFFLAQFKEIVRVEVMRHRFARIRTFSPPFRRYRRYSYDSDDMRADLDSYDGYPSYVYEDDSYYDPYYISSDDEYLYHSNYIRTYGNPFTTWSDFEYEHYIYGEDGFFILCSETEDPWKEINEDLWYRKKQRKDHTPKRRPKQKKIGGRKLKSRVVW